MSRDEFEKYILSFGFEVYSARFKIYRLENYEITLFKDGYYLNHGYKKEYNIPYSNLLPIKKIERSYKLKKILK